MFSSRAVTCRNPRNATPAQNTECAGSKSTLVSVSSAIAKPRLTAGPARLTSVCLRGVIQPVRTYTAPPGSPIPPIAMNSTGNPRDSSGCEYFSGFRVR